ncbi:hypothetical protein [Ralstonia sp. ASV6]|uniref:hypothetical protein n=1 Tax=Ralstonia sp. ASV6 TaxID=2795124 RepID=UPI0018EDDBA5|nr:hypothetical protein [Ralstonia sp. ASV6]
MSKVIQASVEVKFTASSGYRSKEVFGPTAGTTALEDGLREIARILAINGDADKVVAIVSEAISAVTAGKADPNP